MPAVTGNSSLEDVCFAVCTELAHVGTVAVLTGGSAATYYAPEAYQSQDADFVITFSSDAERAAVTLRDLGYRELGGTYKHDRNIFTLEFPPGPLAIGNDSLGPTTQIDAVPNSCTSSPVRIPYEIVWRRSTSSATAARWPQRLA